jgi:hypothetical protein
MCIWCIKIGIVLVLHFKVDVVMSLEFTNLLLDKLPRIFIVSWRNIVHNAIDILK